MTPTTAPADAILIADDDVAFASVLVEFLTEAGFRCRHVPDATQAIAALQREEFPLMIADIGMPGNDNLELVHTLARLPERPRIILLTGQPTVPTAIKAVSLPIAAYLTKPPDHAALLALVRQAVSDYRATRALSSDHHRLQRWADDIKRIQTSLEQTRGGDGGGHFQSYLALTMSNLVAALGDFAAMVAVVDGPGPRRERETASLVKALQETIGVLDKTRRNFHSKELGNLRKKLERLLGETAAPESGGGSAHPPTSG